MSAVAIPDEAVTAPQTTAGAAAAPGATSAAPAGFAHIYVVDDDAAVRSVVKRMLAKEGYELWDTGDPAEAIRHFTAAPPDDRPDLILTDVIMPQMTGLRMIDEIAKVSRDLRVIYMSGYVQSKVEWGGTQGAVVAFLEKPVTRETLLEAVRRVLEHEPPAA